MESIDPANLASVNKGFDKPGEYAVALTAKLRHAIARNPEHSRMEQVELEDVKQWIAIRQNRDFESDPRLQGQIAGRITGGANAFSNSTDTCPLPTIVHQGRPETCNAGSPAMSNTWINDTRRSLV